MQLEKELIEQQESAKSAGDECKRLTRQLAEAAAAHAALETRLAEASHADVGRSAAEDAARAQVEAD